MHSIALKHLFALIFFSIAGLYITYPLIFHLTNMLPGLGDELLITWIMNWNIHSFQSALFSIFNANIFYPYSNTLAFSDTFFTSSLLAFIPVKLFGEPTVAFNITLIFSLILLGFSVYLLTSYLTRNFLPSLISGLLVTFSPAVLDKTTHLQVLTVFFVPLCILYFLKFIDSKKTRYLFLIALFFVLQTYNSFLPGYFIVLSMIIIYILYYFKSKKSALSLITKKNLAIVILSFALIIPTAIPYFQVSSKFNYVRDIRDTIHFALQPEDLLHSSSVTRVNNLLLAFTPKYGPSAYLKPGFIGGAFTILGVLALIYFLKRFRKLDFITSSLFFTATFSLLMSFGPFLHLGRATIHEPFPIPLPYLFFYYLAPGFKGMRASSRWEMLFIITAAVLIGIFLNRILKKKSKLKLIASLLIILLIGLEFNFPMNFVSVKTTSEFPKEYHYLRQTLPNSNIIIMPIYNWNMSPYAGAETLREYYSTLSFNKMVNGFSGFSPPQWEEMVTDLTAYFPSPMTLEKIKELSVDYIVVQTEEYEKMANDNYKIRGREISSKDEILDRIKEYDQLRLIKVYGDTYIYKLN